MTEGQYKHSLELCQKNWKAYVGVKMQPLNSLSQISPQLNPERCSENVPLPRLQVQHICVTG